MLKYKFEIRQIGADGFYFVFRFSANSAFISNFFESIDETRSVIKSLQETALEDRNYLQKTTSSGNVFFLFRLKGVTPVGQSTVFKSSPSLEKSIDLMKSYVRTAEIEDLTIK